jgi:RNA polymerase sigma-70 factor (ECF subfamily)
MGQPGDFDRVLEQHWDRIYQAACHLSGDAVEAEDIAQGTFVEAWKAWPRFEGRCEVYTWLYRILVRHYRRQRRKRWWVDRIRWFPEQDGQSVLHVVPDPHDNPDIELQRADEVVEVRAMMQRVSPKLREVLVLRYGEGLSVEEIAEVLELPAGTVKSRLNLGRQAVADLLQKRGWT